MSVQVQVDMSVVKGIQQGPIGMKDPSLKLLKQKVKRNSAARISGPRLELVDNYDKECIDQSPSRINSRDSPNNLRRGVNPQPPSLPRNENINRSPNLNREASPSETVLPEVNIRSYNIQSQTIDSASKQINILQTQLQTNTSPNTLGSPNVGSTSRPSYRRRNSRDSSSSSSSLTHSQREVVTDANARIEVGLENLGNTCFMNSTLQCLLHIQPLVKYFLHSNVEKDLNLASPKKGMLASSFYHLVHEVYRKKSGSSIAPTNFQRAVGKFAPYLMDFQQQDSQEFLRLVLDGIAEDLCRKHSKNDDNSPIKATSNESTPDVSSYTNNNTYYNNHSNGGNNYNPSHVSGKSGKHVILPVLPLFNPSSSNSNTNQEPFSQTLPIPTSKDESHLHQQFSTSATNSPVNPTQNPRVSASHRLRAETRAMRERQAALDADIGPDINVNSSVIAVSEAAAAFGFGDQVSSSGGKGRRVGATRDSLSPVRSTTDPGDAELRNSGQRETDGSVLNPVNRINADIEMSKQLNSELEGADGEASESRSSTSAPKEGRRRLRIFPSRSSRDPSPVITERGQAGDQTVAVQQSVEKRRSLFGSGIMGGSRRGAALKEESNQQQNEGEQKEVKVPSLDEEAAVAWKRYLQLNDSIITDLFAGMLQSTIECLTCHHKSNSFDPFLDLSVPIYRDPDATSGKGGFLGSFRTSNPNSGITGADSNKSTIEKCLAKFTAEEFLDGDNMYMCEKCRKKRKSLKQLYIYRYPKILVVHIKRFRFSTTRREKLSTDVHFPLSGLDLSPYISPSIVPLFQTNGKIVASVEPDDKKSTNNSETAETNTTPPTKTPDSTCINPTIKPDLNPPIYDLIGVSNHHGNLHAGHYIAHVDTNPGTGSNASRWVCFNDARVSYANPASIAGPTAYVLFYQLREDGQMEQGKG